MFLLMKYNNELGYSSDHGGHSASQCHSLWHGPIDYCGRLTFVVVAEDLHNDEPHREIGGPHKTSSKV